MFTDHFFDFSLKLINPLLLHVALTPSIMSIFGQLSQTAASWLLDTQSITVELCLTRRLLPSHSPIALSDEETKILKRFPRTLKTAIGWFNIDPPLVIMNCCRGCFALYPPTLTPHHCNHLVSCISGGLVEDLDSDTELDQSSLPGYDKTFAETTCGHPLLKLYRGKEVPISRYAFQNLADWIACLLSRPQVEHWLDQSLEESLKPFKESDEVTDIHQSRIWKQFRGPDGSQFTSKSGNLTFGLFIDAIKPYGNKISGKHASITFIVLVCLTLPVNIRHLPKHVFLVGIAPGPREPSLEQNNWILRPIVTQLQTLWNPGLLLSRTHLYKGGRLIRAALLPFIADIPAIRRSLGFPSANATILCSICLITKSEINNLDPTNWPRRTCAQHKKWAWKSRDASTAAERASIFETHGVRYSVLVELEYWDIVEFHVVDSMHNLLLGLLAWNLRRFWSMQDIQNEEQKTLPISTAELMNLWSEHSQPLPPESYAENIVDDSEDDTDQDIESHHKEMLAQSITSHTNPSDKDFDPLLNDGWDGKWEAPPLDEVIFDSEMLRTINALLPRVHIPTWVKRAIPYLGKASFGKFKADEWRNLFTIQLPLTLVPIWSGKGPVQKSLLQNFCHLVSLVNVALKRSMTSTLIDQYRYHIQQYLQGSLVLLEHCKLAPNHHMAIHLSECLERFGPVRAWWSFPFERLMGSILKGCHNNRLGMLS